MSKIKTLKEIDVKDKRVLLRLDLNVPLDAKQEITDNTRIKAALPTIRYLFDQGAKIIIASHLGRPKGEFNEKYSLKPVAEELAKLLNQPILFLEDCVGQEIKEVVEEMGESSIALLENVRFYSQETDNNPQFAKDLADLAEVYVNDAFGTAHRAHASTAGVTEFIQTKAIGFLIEKELDFLVNKINEPNRPFVVVLGGAKVSDKIGVIEALIEKADSIIIGGGMAYTFMLAEGKSTGDSLVEPDKVDLAKNIIQKAKDKNVKLHLPTDWLITDKVDFEKQALGNQKIAEEEIPSGWEGVDIGPKSISAFKEILSDAKTILWNGPLGIFEIPDSSKGSFEIAKAVANTDSISIIGGGDCVKAANNSGVQDKITFLSTGGGATLQLIEGKQLPGIEALKE